MRKRITLTAALLTMAGAVPQSAIAQDAAALIASAEKAAPATVSAGAASALPPATRPAPAIAARTDPATGRVIARS